MSEPNNPQAFPMTGEGYSSPQYSQYGMTLRDWFAGQALVGAVNGGVPAYPNGTKPDFSAYAQQQAQLAYAIADAMLTERDNRT